MHKVRSELGVCSESSHMPVYSQQVHTALCQFSSNLLGKIAILDDSCFSTIIFMTMYRLQACWQGYTLMHGCMHGIVCTCHVYVSHRSCLQTASRNMLYLKHFCSLSAAVQQACPPARSTETHGHRQATYIQLSSMDTHQPEPTSGTNVDRLQQSTCSSDMIAFLGRLLPKPIWPPSESASLPAPLFFPLCLSYMSCMAGLP